MKYFKTITGYVAIDDTTKVHANGTTVPTNILAYGRGPTRPLDAESVAARVFDVVALTREGQQVEADEVPENWRVALGLVKVEPVCPMPAGETPETVNRLEVSVTPQVFFLFGFLVGVAFVVLLSLYH